MDSRSLSMSTHAGTLAAASINGHDDRARPPLLSLFFAFQIIGGHIGFPILIAVVFALRNASSRHPLFINFCIIWVISSVVFCILLYTGYDTGPEPPYMICAIQSSLVYAMPVMASVSLSALVFHLWLTLRASMDRGHVRHSRLLQWTLVGLPYLIAIPYIIVSALIASMRPDLVALRRTGFGFNCSADSDPLRVAVAISVAIFLVLLLVWEFLVARILYLNWRSVRTVKVYGWTGVNLLVRVAIFTLYVVSGIVACTIAIVLPTDRIRILFQASLPTAAFFLFATRPALWRRESETPARIQSGSSVRLVNSRTSPSNSWSTAQVSTLSYKASAFKSAQSPTGPLHAVTRSYSTDVDKKNQVKRSSTFMSASSVYSASEREEDIPPLPIWTAKQTVLRDVGPEGPIRPELEPEGTTWTDPFTTSTSESVRGPDAVEKGIQGKGAYNTSASDIKPAGGRPPKWI